MAARPRPRPLGPHECPTHDTEEGLVRIWQEIFGSDEIGTNDDFFALGGDSLIAIRIIAEIRQKLDLEPTIKDLLDARTVAELASQLERKTAIERGAPIRPSSPRMFFPLSYPQQQLWLAEKLVHGGSAYNVPIVLRLNGVLDQTALLRSTRALVERHRALRTVFVEIDNSPAQLLRDTPDTVIDFVDLSQCVPESRSEVINTVIRQFVNSEFNLSADYPFRIAAIRVRADETLLVIVVHHIACDGWSLNILTHELGELYKAAIDGLDAALPELTLQYTDFAVWQREHLSTHRIQCGLSFWKRYLDRVPTVLELPVPNSRSTIMTSEGAQFRFELSARVYRDVTNISIHHGVTPCMTMFAAYAAVLSFWSGQRDLIIGVPVTARLDKQLCSLVGFFVNTLPLKVQMTPEMTFSDLLGCVRRSTLDAYSHQDVPFDKIVAELQPNRQLSRPPLVQVMFAFDNVTRLPVRFGDLAVAEYPVYRQTSVFEITLFVKDDGSNYQCVLEYSTALHNEERMQFLGQTFERALEQFCQQPERRIVDVDLLSKHEKRRILSRSGATHPVTPGCIHDAFDEAALRFPTAIALIDGNSCMTYRELRRLSEKFGYFFARYGITADKVVAIYAKASFKVIAAILGTFRSGGTYLPLDRSYPNQRIRFMLKDANAVLTLTDGLCADEIYCDGMKLLPIDRIWPTISSQAPVRLPVVSPSGLAYIIYTSGSTGKPKAVMMEHRALSNHMSWMASEFPLNTGDRVLQRTSMSFDASLWEIFAPLISGATVVLSQVDSRLDFEQLGGEISRHEVTRFQGVPDLLRCGSEVWGKDSLRTVQDIFCGGGPLTPDILEKYVIQHGKRLHNLYGPTETCIESVVHTCSALDASNQTVPIGLPIWNTRAYVLDSELRLLPEGARGELYIAGAGLARGYLNLPGLTSERFVADPFWGSGERMYRTGDIVRWNREGKLEFMGRVDDQIKIRGFRVECGEIETLLLAHPAVTQAVVVPCQAGTTQMLAAYVVCAPNAPCTVEALRTHLRRDLPDFMMPAHILISTALPMLPNGKIDRSRLPAPKTNEHLELGQLNEVEYRMQKLWCEVFQFDDLSPDKDFFDIGGNSLLAVRLMARLRSEFDVDLPVRSLFEESTVRRLSARVVALKVAGAATDSERTARITLQEAPLWFLRTSS